MTQSLFINGVPKANALAVQDNHYFYAGQLMACSLLQGGPTPNILANWCYKILSKPNDPITMENIDFSEDFLQNDSVVKVQYCQACNFY